MKKIKLNKEEQLIENELSSYLNVTTSEFNEIADSLRARKKDAVMNIRINKKDLEAIKQISKKLGVKYQSFISELIHRAAKSA
jgi:predicted DNA binding CopG/RHH family protein